MPEDTVDYLGLALATNGTPLADRPVTLKRSDTLATLASTVTDASGLWRFDDISPANIVRAEISAGTTPQIAVKSCWSGDAYSLYIREKLTAAPAAIFNLPPLANIYSNSVLLTTALDGRYVNTTGDTIVGPLTVEGPGLFNDGVVVGFGNLSLTSGDLNVSTGHAAIGGNLTVTGGIGASAISVGSNALNLTSTGLVRAPNGTLATPAFSFGSDPNTGIIRSAEGEMTLVTNGVARLQVAPTGVGLTGSLVVDDGQLLLDGPLTVSGDSTFNNPATFNLEGSMKARVWMNGANSQFASYAVQTYIANQILMGGTQAATSVTGVVRAFAVRDGSGNILGWTPIYGAVN